MNDSDKEMLNYYGEQLKTIRRINKSLEDENDNLIAAYDVLQEEYRLRKRENGILICFVISLALWIATT